MMRGFLATILGALLGAHAAVAQIVDRPVPGDPVTLDSGKIAGKLLPSGIRAYFGVPFAAPPVRGLRWKDPQPVQPWTGVYNADRFAPECIQPLRAHDINHYFGEEATSEDCLYLNIWAPSAPAPTGKPYPVVVWIYGGGFTIGSASMANYSGESLAGKGVVYVAIAYRLGPFGFLAHPGLSAESPHHSSGNYGLLDQVAALQWIHRNIAGFGGDTGNVTIMGQSAGSMSVSLLQTDPLAKGLFQRAVGMSGASFGDVLEPRPLADAEKVGVAAQAALKADSLAAMRSLPADKILQVAQRFPLAIDGYALPAKPARIFADHRQSDVPLMIGYLADEGFRSIGPTDDVEQYKAALRANFGKDAGKVLTLYPAATDAAARRAAIDIGRDSTVAAQMNLWAKAQTADGHAPVYAYFFSRVHPYTPGITFSDHDPKTVGAYHTGDVPYWLETQDSLNLFRQTRRWTDYDRHLADLMSSALVAFAASGNPNGGSLPVWPAFDAKRPNVMMFGDDIRAGLWPNGEKLPFFETSHHDDANPGLRSGGHD